MRHRWMRMAPVVLSVLLPALCLGAWPADGDEPGPATSPRVRVIIETDAGGDPDDEQSLVRFLLYANEMDVEGIIATRPTARPGENRNPERTGLGIVRAQLRAYGQCLPMLRRHDRRYPSQEELWRRTVPGYDDTDDGVRLIMRAVDGRDPRPVWFCNWGTDQGSGGSSLRRALDRVRSERGVAAYARFKSRLRLSSSDEFADHMTADPPFPLWVDTFRPEVERRRWYHRFSAITATAGGFDIERDVRRDHGPLGALYPTNTTHPQKEGDSMTFLYLIPTGMNDPFQPGWGSWAGRYGPNPEHPGKPYYWANQADEWEGTTHRENSLKRWAVHLQNDFRARMDWCVQPFEAANHPPRVRVEGPRVRRVPPGRSVVLDASRSRDPDGRPLSFRWVTYPEAGTMPNAPRWESREARWEFSAPNQPGELHLVLDVTDQGSPPLTRYARVIVKVETPNR